MWAHLRRHTDLQCARCRVPTPARETQEGDLVTAASSGGRSVVVGEASDLLESVAGVRDDVRGNPRGGHRVRASVDGVSDVTLAVGRQQRRDCPVLPRDFVGRCGALGSATLVHVPNPAREELCAIFCDGLEGMLDGDDNWSKIAQCTHRLLLGAVPKGVGYGELIVWRNFSRDGSNKDGALSSLDMVTPPVITLTVARSGRNVLRGRVLGARRLVDSGEVLSLCLLRNNVLGLRS